MTLTPLIDAPVAIQIHAFAAIFAVGLGPIALYRTRRDMWHKIFGYLWVAAMVLVALSCLWITAGVGPTLYGFGLIHGLALVVFGSLYAGIKAAVAREIARHAGIMRALYWQSLGIAGLFTLLPGRMMNEVIFGARPDLGLWALGLGLLGIGVMSLRRRSTSAGPSQIRAF